MTREEVLGELRERFGDDIVEILDKSQKRLYVEIKPEALVPVATYIFREKGARFHIASGMDARRHLEICRRGYNKPAFLSSRGCHTACRCFSLWPDILAVNVNQAAYYRFLGPTFHEVVL